MLAQFPKLNRSKNGKFDAVDAMKAYWVSRNKPHSFLTAITDETEYSNSRSGRFIPEETLVLNCLAAQPVSEPNQYNQYTHILK